MNPDDARVTLTEALDPNRATREGLDYPAFERLFSAASEVERERILEAAVTLLLEGKPDEQAFAATFLANHGPTPAQSDRLGEAYLSDADVDRQAIAHAIGRFTSSTTADMVDQLAEAFEDDPEAHLPLAELLLSRKSDDEALWAAFWEAVDASDDVRVLKRAFDAAYVGRRTDAFFERLADRDDSLLKQLAPQLPTGFGAQLLRAARRS